MENTACRKILHGAWVSRDRFLDNPGLALARYLSRHATQQEKRQGQRPEVLLIQSVASSGVSEAYKTAFSRWKQIASGKGFCAFTGTAAAPLAVGLGNESPLEVGIRLNFTYGIPVIPGSALKGLCRRVARLLLDRGDLSRTQFEVVFGAAEGDGESHQTQADETHGGPAASFIVFWDAWFDPGSVGGQPFKQDVVTIHHPEYYGTKGENWPTDFDDPNPVPFLVVRPGSRFLFSICAPDVRWAGFVARLMQWGLVELGIGGKTNAGYGRFSDAWEVLACPASTEETIQNCKINRHKAKGIVFVTISAGDQEIQVEQREWQPLEDSLPPDKKEQLRKKGTLHANVVVKRERSGVRVLSVMPL